VRTLIFLLLALPGFAWAQPRGIFIYAGAAVPGPVTMSAPVLEGLTAVLKWHEIEATRGVYDWTVADAFVATARAYRKQLILGVRHGCVSGCAAADTNMPAWYTGPTFTCESGEVGPQTWRPEFLTPWRELQHQLILRYRAEPEVVGFILSGVSSWKFAEMAPNTVCSLAATQHDRDHAIAQGYTRRRLQDAMLALANDMAALTTKPLRFIFARIIDETDGTASMAQTVDWIIEPLRARFRVGRRGRPVHLPVNRFPALTRLVAARTVSQIAFMQSSLSGLRGDPGRVWNTSALQPFEQALYDLRPEVSWQLDIPANGGPDTADALAEAGDIGLHYGMRWLEVKNVDVVDTAMQPVLHCLNRAMLAGGGHCGH
jgi:hypothetical protein